MPALTSRSSLAYRCSTRAHDRARNEGQPGILKNGCATVSLQKLLPASPLDIPTRPECPTRHSSARVATADRDRDSASSPDHGIRFPPQPFPLQRSEICRSGEDLPAPLRRFFELTQCAASLLLSLCADTSSDSCRLRRHLP